jgi:hypothetical protein
VKKKSGLSYTCSFDTVLLETAAGCTAAVSAVKQNPQNFVVRGCKYTF